MLLPVVAAKRGAFNTARYAVIAVRDSAATTISALWTAWNATFAGRPAIDLTVTESIEEEKALRLILRDMLLQTEGLLAEIDKRLAKGDDFVTKAAAAAGEAKANLLIDAAKAFLGDGIRLVPRFTLGADQGDEWQNAFDDRAALLAHLARRARLPGGRLDAWCRSRTTQDPRPRERDAH